MIEQVLAIIISLLLMVTGLAFGTLAVGIAMKLASTYRAASRSRSWLATPGRITHSEMVWTGARSRSPRPVLNYAYSVGGATYEGRRLEFEYSHLYTREVVEQILEEYPAGAKTVVYYDPQDPQESSLRQAHVGLVSGLFVGGMLLLPMALCLASGIIGFVDTVRAW